MKTYLNIIWLVQKKEQKFYKFTFKQIYSIVNKTDDFKIKTKTGFAKPWPEVARSWPRLKVVDQGLQSRS